MDTVRLAKDSWHRLMRICMSRYLYHDVRKGRNPGQLMGIPGMLSIIVRTAICSGFVGRHNQVNNSRFSRRLQIEHSHKTKSRLAKKWPEAFWSYMPGMTEDQGGRRRMMTDDVDYRQTSTDDGFHEIPLDAEIRYRISIPHHNGPYQDIPHVPAPASSTRGRRRSVDVQDYMTRVSSASSVSNLFFFTTICPLPPPPSCPWKKFQEALSTALAMSNTSS